MSAYIEYTKWSHQLVDVSMLAGNTEDIYSDSDYCEQDCISLNTFSEQGRELTFLRMESAPLLGQDSMLGRARTSSTVSDPCINENALADPQFAVLFRDADMAIQQGLCPHRIKQGSSGSYFVQGVHRVRIVWIICNYLARTLSVRYAVNPAFKGQSNDWVPSDIRGKFCHGTYIHVFSAILDAQGAFSS